MLKQLTIANFVLVDALDIQFQSGLTTITGESGAGKSILLGALGLLLGERARADVVRPGAAKADINAEFDLRTSAALGELLARDELLTDDPHDCFIRRVVSNDGRSRAFINGTPVTLQYLQQVGRHLVDVYGQNEHQQLADRQEQLTLLDEFAGQTAKAARVGALYRQWQLTNKQIAELEANRSALLDRQELLAYQLRELDEVALQEGEFARIEVEQRRLAQASKLLDVVGNALASLDDQDAQRHAIAKVNAIDDEHPDLASAQSTLTSALELFDDAYRDLRRYQEQLVVDPQALQDVEDRLDLILGIARKHRTTPGELHAHTESLRTEFAALARDDSDLDALRRRVGEEETAYREQAKTLSQARRSQAKKFSKAVSACMHKLGMPDGELTVAFTETQSELGLETVDFLVKTNAKFAPAPLSRVASGGEQTRISLSIQIVAAQTSALPCLVLDEADVGVGGTTADTIGRILRDLARHTQIICVTHAPQVAALGHNHLRVSKSRDSTRIETLDATSRVEELARMLAGADVTAKSRDYASALLSEANA